MDDVCLDELYGDDGFRPEEGEQDLYGDLYGDISEAAPALPSTFSLEKQIQARAVCATAAPFSRIHAPSRPPARAG